MMGMDEEVMMGGRLRFGVRCFIHFASSTKIE